MPPESASRTPFPGIFLATGGAQQLFGNADETASVLEKHYGVPLSSYCECRINESLVAWGITSQPSENNYFSGEDGISVIFEGYLSDYTGNKHRLSTGHSFAQFIAKLYRDNGLSFLEDLRGSYICLVADQRQGKVFLFNDRQGSRPMFVRKLADDSLLYAPQISFLASIEPKLTRLNPAGVGQFLIRGCFYGNDTLYTDIEKFPQGTVTTFGTGRPVSQQYWRYQFDKGHAAAPRNRLIDEFDDLVARATKRLLAIADNPVILLSGGLDSRLMLGYLVREGAGNIPALSYNVNNTDGDDHIIARQLADFCGMRHEQYEIHEDDYRSLAQKEVLAVDGRVQVLDSPSSRWEHIGGHFNSIFIGDECFGWGRHANTIAEALDVVGWFNLDKACRIADWLTPAARRIIHRDIENTQKHLVSQSGETVPDDIKDNLYYTERMGNMLNGYGARRLWLMEQARPFLDEDVIEFISRLPPEQRNDKTLARNLMEDKFPDLHALPYSRRDSVPWWPPQFISITANNTDLYEFIVSSLTDNLNPGLAELLDQDRLGESIPRLFSGLPLPPLRGEWWTRIPGLWRYSRAPHDKVGAVRGALRLLGLNLYLNA